MTEIAFLLRPDDVTPEWLTAVLRAAGLDWVDDPVVAGVSETDGRALWALLGYARDWVGRLAVG